MKITIFAAGSRGDVQPCVILSKGLQQAGYTVTLAAPKDFTEFIQNLDVDFHPLGGDVQKIMAGDTGRNFMESGGANPLKSIRAMRIMLAPVVMQMLEDAFAACRDADGLICQGVLAAFGKSIADVLGIPIINIEPTPLLPTRAFAAPSWPIQKDLSGWHNYFSGVMMLQVVWMWYQPYVNAFRKRFGLPAYSGADFRRVLQSTPMLSAYSSAIIPHPPDWQEHIYLTGYLFPDTLSAWQPSAELTAFLEAGDPPVYIGFGSMAGINPEQLTRLIFAALSKSGQRGLLLTGWGGLRAEWVPKNVFIVDSVPHGWLFPRMAAVVHHGGAGTTAEGLRAGTPTVIVPFAFDQSFWGSRVKAMGLGPEPINKRHLTAERLAQAIEIAVSDTGIRQRAQACSQIIRAEDGIGYAVNIVKQYFGRP